MFSIWINFARSAPSTSPDPQMPRYTRNWSLLGVSFYELLVRQMAIIFLWARKILGGIIWCEKDKAGLSQLLWVKFIGVGQSCVMQISYYGQTSISSANFGSKFHRQAHRKMLVKTVGHFLRSECVEHVSRAICSAEKPCAR